MKKSNYIKPDSDDVNMVSEPEMAYTYANQANYEPVFIEKFNKIEQKPIVREQKILQPDENFHRAISAEEFRKRALAMASELDKKYAKK